MGLTFIDLELTGSFVTGWSGAILPVDTYGPNPYVTALSAEYPGVFKAASERRPAPTLFASSDLPSFTASGVDPARLADLPFTLRHAAASENSVGKLLEWIEQSMADREASKHLVIPHAGLIAYRDRVNAWVAGIDPDGQGTAALGNAYPDQWRSPRMRAAAGGLS
jgi:hypothetical protein